CAARERVRVFERPGRDRQLHEQAMALEGSPYAAELRALGRAELREVDLATRATEGMDQLDERLGRQAGRGAAAKHVAAPQHADHERRVGNAEAAGRSRSGPVESGLAQLASGGSAARSSRSQGER